MDSESLLHLRYDLELLAQPDRELDVAFLNVMFPSSLTHVDKEYDVWIWEPPWGGTDVIPKLTESLDDCLKIVHHFTRKAGRVWTWAVFDNEQYLYQARVERLIEENWVVHFSKWAVNPAIALLGALLTAEYAEATKSFENAIVERF